MKNKTDQYREKHYLIYKITNTDNGMIYIGKHQTYDVNDNYMGSSPYLNIAIQKHGLDKFKKEILFDFDSYEEMNAKEIELVNEAFISRTDTYNVELGGNGGWNAVNDVPYKWICNPFTKTNRKLYADTLSDQMIKAGWTYGTLANKAISLIVKDIDGKDKTIRQFAKEHNLDEYFTRRRHELGWSINELITIPEEYRESKISPIERYRLNNTARLEKQKEDTMNKNIQLAHELYREYSEIGKDKFKQLHLNRYRACLDLFRRYVKEYNVKKQHSTYKIEYNGKLQSMSKWCKELNISKWTLYSLLKQNKSFQEAFDILKSS